MAALLQMTVAKRLGLGFGFVVALMLLSGLASWRALSNSEARLEDIVNDKVPKLNGIATINYNVLDIARGLRNALLEDEDPAKMEEHIQRVLEARGRIKATVEHIEPLIRLPEGQAIFKRILDARSNFIEGQETVIKLLRERKTQDVRTYLLTEMRRRQAAYAEATGALQQLQERLLAETSQAARQDVHSSVLQIAALVLVAAALAALAAWLIVRDLRGRLGGEPGYAAEMVGAIAAGDITREVALNPGDRSSMMFAVRNMQESLATLVKEIQDVVAGAAAGDFSGRIPLSGKTGFGRDIGEALNRLAETTQSGLDDVTRVAQALAAGEIDKRIDKSYPGVFGQTAQAINATVDALQVVIGDIDRLVQAASRGDFSVWLELDQKRGFGRELAELLNRLSALTDSGLRDIMRVANTLAEGDLTQTIDKDYPGLFGEARNGINATVANLTRLVSSIKDAVALIQTAANEFAAGNQDLSARTEEQASSLEQTASSMEQLNSTVKENTEGARKAKEDAQAASLVAERGGSTVKGSVVVMENIAESSKKIGDIVGVIDSIAFQTNILALNAAVEAARAGEQGRGFAVVATEVRALAQRSAEAAKEIKGLIAETVSRIDGGAQQARLAGEQMEEIVGAISNVSRVITDISSAGIEQASGIEQISQAVEQMDQVTQQNAALVEQAAAAAESLREQADQLADAVARFKVADVAASVPRRAAPAMAALTRGGVARRLSPPQHANRAKPGTGGTDSADGWDEF